MESELIQETDTELIVRCVCGQGFPIEKTRGTHLVKLKRKIPSLRCIECYRANMPKVEKSNRKYAPVQTEPNKGTKSYEVYKLLLEGWHYGDAALKVRLTEQAAEKVYWRYVVPRQKDEMIAQLSNDLMQAQEEIEKLKTSNLIGSKC